MHVGVVGAGITGLALQHYLGEYGVESVVFEASDRPGGVIRSIEREGRILDLGPQRTRMTCGVRTLVEAAGLTGQIREANDGPLYVYHDGDLGRVPRSIREALSTDLLSWRGKARALLEPIAGPPREGETVRGYLERAFGSEVAVRVGGPLYAGLYASDPAEMPVEHSLAKALDHLGVERSVLLAALRKRIRGREPPPAVSFDDGMGTLPRGLYRIHEDAVHLETPVERIAGSDDGYELVTPDGSHLVDRIVLTVPAPSAADLLRDVDPDTADHLAALAYNPLAVVHLLADADLAGAGHQTSLTADLATRGVTWNDSLLDRDGVYTCYLGGATRRGLVERRDDELGALAAREFERVTGEEAEPIAVNRVRPGMPAYDASWDELRHVNPPEGIHLCANYESRAGIPGRARRARVLADELATRANADDGGRREANAFATRQRAVRGHDST